MIATPVASGAGSRDWLAPWADAVGASAAFVGALDAALAEEAARLAGIDVRQGFALLPDDAGGEIAFDPDGAGRSGAVLIAIAQGFEVAIAWRCAHHPGERVAPSDPLPPARGCRLTASWIGLPAAELRAQYSGPVAPPFRLSPRAFEVQTWALVWPDLWFAVEVRAKGPDVGGLLKREFDDAAAAWNDGHPEAPIGLPGDPRQLGAGTWEIFVPFGDHGPAALDSLLAALAGVVVGSVPRIFRVVLRSFPIRL